MRAAVYDRYGPPDVLRIEDVPVPSPKPNEVLVRVAATSINLSDWECLTGSPLYARIGGMRAPATRTLGSDIAGTVEAAGANGFARSSDSSRSSSRSRSRPAAGGPRRATPF